MKLYAQHGYGPGDKLISGLSSGVIDGVILGAKDAPNNQLSAQVAMLQQASPAADILFDCHYYASVLPHRADNRLGKLADYPYWGQNVRNDLYFLNQQNLRDDIRQCLEFQNSLPLTASIAPNIIIRHSFNSRDGATATAFINLAAEISQQINPNRRVLATLALSREALLDTTELEQFVHLITGLPNPPDGFYLLLAVAGQLPSEIFHANVVANLLYLVSALKLNGFDVVVGYSDLLGPVLASVGADAGCSGWFTTLRMFSLNRFEPSSGGGKPPRPLYLSTRLFNRILVSELLPAYSLNPNVRNNLPTDGPYFQGGQVSEPNNKTEECLQSWEALRTLQRFVSQGSRLRSHARITTILQDARAFYEALRRQGMTFESKSADSHLVSLLQGVAEFQQSV